MLYHQHTHTYTQTEAHTYKHSTNHTKTDKQQHQLLEQKNSNYFTAIRTKINTNTTLLHPFKGLFPGQPG